MKVNVNERGQKPKTLIDMVSCLETLNREMTIYAAEPWHPDSSAILVLPEDDGRIAPMEAKVFPHRYFLEVSIAQELINGWLKHANPSAIEQCERLILYAINDG